MSAFQPKFKSVNEIYENSIKQFGSRPLFGTKVGTRWEWLTYSEFAIEVEAMRAALADLGVVKGDRVATISNNRKEWAVAAFATYGLGATYVPMYESQQDKDWSYILGDCGAKVVFVANASIHDRVVALRENIKLNAQPQHPAFNDGELFSHVVVMDGNCPGATETYASMLKRGEGKSVPATTPESSEIAGFIYTSGTTGNPKGVLLSHGNFANNVSAIHAVFPMEPTDRSLSFLPWAHSFGQTVELYGLFSLGGALAVNDHVDNLVANLGDVKPTLLFSVPRVFNRIYDRLNKRMSDAGGVKKKLFDAALRNAAKRRALADSGRSSGVVEFKHRVFDKLVFSKVRDGLGGQLRYAFSGGAALSKEVAEFIDSLGIMVYEGYGLTETSPIATANYPGSRKIGSVGRAVPGVTISIDTEVTGDPVQGEILVTGHNVMQGYYGLDAENKKVFVGSGEGRAFRTGDMGKLDDDGFLFITGRIKEQYKLLNGKYVVPTPLEEAIKLSPYVSSAMVYGMNQNYNVALLIPDFEVLSDWAKANGVQSSDPEALTKDAKVKALFEGEISKCSAAFKSYERVKDFVLGAEDFSTDNGLLTPKMSVKRHAVMGRYGDAIKSLYSN